jgi:hypothetical protein
VKLDFFNRRKQREQSKEMMKKKTKEFSTGENRENGVFLKHPLLSPLPPVQFFLLLILGVFLFA